MQNTLLTTCKECVSIPDLIKGIDCKIAKLSSTLYNNIAFDLNKDVDTTLITKLIRYKRILNYKYYSNNYNCEYSITSITNKVIKLINGCKSKCPPNIKCN